MRLSNIYLHQAVCTPQQIQKVCESTGLVPTQSTREKNKILLVTPEALMIREALKGMKKTLESIKVEEVK